MNHEATKAEINSEFARDNKAVVNKKYDRLTVIICISEMQSIHTMILLYGSC